MTAPPSGTSPYWASEPLPQCSPLAKDTSADVVVVGGGITGLTAACLLAQAGRTVVVLERGRCASVDTGHTSAHLTMVTDARLTESGDDVLGRLHAHGMPGRVESCRAHLGLPCHGSRFMPDGKVISGPAESPLPRVE